MKHHSNYAPLTPRLALRLAAPHTWVASVYPALFGILCCALKGFPLHPFCAALLFFACILFQSAVNTLNDYMDYAKGTDSAEDNVEVTDAVLIYSNINPISARNLGAAYLAAGSVLGLAGAWGKGAAPLLIGIAGGLVILLYSGGPLPLSYLPLGEPVSGFVMGGLIPLGIAACSDGQFHWKLLLWCLPLILGIGLIMMSNNGCDIEKDLRAGRKTLPALLGRERTLLVYRAATALWIALVAVFSALLAGWSGAAVCIVLLAVFAREKYASLLHLRLLPAERIRQMKAIAAANLTGNGAYLAAILVRVVINGIHG